MQSNITKDGERRETIKKQRKELMVKTLYKTLSLHSSAMSQFL